MAPVVRWGAPRSQARPCRLDWCNATHVPSSVRKDAPSRVQIRRSRMPSRRTWLPEARTRARSSLKRPESTCRRAWASQLCRAPPHRRYQGGALVAVPFLVLVALWRWGARALHVRPARPSRPHTSRRTGVSSAPTARQPRTFAGSPLRAADGQTLDERVDVEDVHVAVTVDIGQHPIARGVLLVV